MLGCNTTFSKSDLEWRWKNEYANCQGPDSARYMNMRLILTMWSSHPITHLPVREGLFQKSVEFKHRLAGSEEDVNRCSLKTIWRYDRIKFPLTFFCGYTRFQLFSPVTENFFQIISFNNIKIFPFNEVKFLFSY